MTHCASTTGASGDMALPPARVFDAAFRQRVLSSLVMAAGVLAAVLADGWLFVVLVLAAIVVMAHEWSRLTILLGIVTGVAGGILRDVLLGEVPLVFRREIHLYATAALGGAALYVGLHAAGVAGQIATTSGVLVTLALRLAGIRWKISLPLLETR